MPATSPNLPATSASIVGDRLRRLIDLLGKGLISQKEYDVKREQILGEI
jgi:hypothetical protein